jgi:hypothetical protein
MLSHHRLLLKHKKEGHNVVFFFFFLDTKKKATTTSYCYLLRFNTTIKEGNGRKLPSPSLLQQHHKRNNDALPSSFSSLT